MAGKKTNAFLGWPKPIFTEIVKTNKNYKAVFQSAMMFAHYELSATDLKKEVFKYVKALDAKHPFLDRVKDVDENRFSTIGKYAYITNHGGQLPDDIAAGLLSSLEKLLTGEESRTLVKENARKQLVGKENEVAVTPKPVISIQDRLRDKAREVAGEVEGWLDDLILDKNLPAKTVDEFTGLFKTHELKSPHARHMQTIFERRAEEISIVANGSDKELIEGYSNFTKPQLKRFELTYKNLLKACDMMQEVAKIERVPRKKKPVSQEKLVARMKYKKEDATLGIVSANPIQIIGAKEVWIYNTKTRKLSQYKAIDERGLSVKGTSIIDFSSESAEKTLRKPAEALAELKKASKVKLRTFLKDLSTLDIPCLGKINEHHVILRVDK